MSEFYWEPNQQNRINFVMVDASDVEVTGLGAALTIQISKNGGAFAAAAGTISELGDGFYSYVSTAGEADTIGPVAITVNGAGAVQQNLEYVVRSRVINVSEFTYTVTDNSTGLPIEGVYVAITTVNDVTATPIFEGLTDAAGVLRETSSLDLPLLVTGNTHYFWSQKSGYSFTNPDIEVA